MSTRAKSSKRSKAIDRPFAPQILKRAKETATRYRIVVGMEDEEFFGRCLELPLVMGHGRTADKCVKNVRKALVATIAYMFEEGVEENR
jgi:predicted RNase H-like HicB family nuclease